MTASKYLNKKTVVDGITFDSKKESQRYIELKILERGKAIDRLQRQVSFPLIKKSQYGREIVYRADFVYYEDGKMVVEDVKSDFTRKDKVYRLKRRMMMELYGITIKEV